MAADAPTTDPPERYRFGVLIVSGMSEPRCGTALVRASDALRGCLDRWLTRDDQAGRDQRTRRAELDAARNNAKGSERDRLEAELAQLDATPPPPPAAGVREVTLKADEEAPAHLTLSIAQPGAAAAQPVDDWCFAESWWAGDFQPPGVAVLIRWMLKVAPIVVLRHFIQSFRRLRRNRHSGIPFVWLSRLLAALVRLVLAPFVAVLATVFSLALLLLASLPVPKLSAAVRGLLGQLGAHIGDSYALLESPTRFGAVLRRVQRDLAWLEARCDRVAVIGEGQGAVVAHRCLQGREAGRVALFATVGSGLRKVAELEEMARTRSGVWLGWAVSFLTALVIVCMVFAAVVGGAATLALIVALYALFFLVIFYAVAFSETSGDRRRIEAALQLTGGPGGPRWVDFFASADPVPNGPVFERTPEWFESCEVWSTASTLGDGRSYWRNPDGFLLPLAQRLIATAECPEVAATVGLEREAVRATARRRAARVFCLLSARLLIALPALFAGWSMRHDLERAADRIVAHAPQWIKSAVAAVFKPFHDLFDLLGLETRELVAIGLIVAGIGVLMGILQVAWAAWGRREIAQAFRREPFGLGGAFAVCALVVALWSAIVLVQAGANGSWHDYVQWLDHRHSPYYGPAVYSGLMAYGALTTSVILIAAVVYARWGWRRLRGHAGPTPCPSFSERVNPARSGAGTLVVVVTTVLLALPGMGGVTQQALAAMAIGGAWGCLRPATLRRTARQRAAVRDWAVRLSTRDPAARAADAR